MKNIILFIIFISSITASSQINILVHSEKERTIKRLSDSLNFSYVKLQRMKDTYSIVISHRDSFPRIRRRLKRNSNTTIIGGWNKAGKALIMPNIVDNHSRSKYRAHLKRRITKNKEGEVVEDREYTDDELKDGVINQIYGWNKREY